MICRFLLCLSCSFEWICEIWVLSVCDEMLSLWFYMVFWIVCCGMILFMLLSRNLMMLNLCGVMLMILLLILIVWCMKLIFMLLMYRYL